ALGLHSVEVREEIEILVQHRTIVLARSNEHGGLPAKEEVVRILGMKPKRRENCRVGGVRREGERTSDDDCKGLANESNLAGAAGNRPARSADRDFPLCIRMLSV